MILNLFSVKDKVTQVMRAPFVMRNNEEALRAFKMSCKEVPEMAKIASDLELYKLGTFDEETGVIKNKIEFLQQGYNGEFLTATNNNEGE